MSCSAAEGPSGEEASEGRDEDFNYDVEYKSKCTGLGALLGAIRNQEEGEIFDDDEGENAGDNESKKKRKKSGRKRQHEDEEEDEQYYEAGKFFTKVDRELETFLSTVICICTYYCVIHTTCTNHEQCAIRGGTIPGSTRSP